MLVLAHLALLSTFGGVMASPIQTTVMDFLCFAFNLNTVTGGVDGSMLDYAFNVSATIIECQYLDGDACYYSREYGNMQNGSANCPPSIDPPTYTESQYDCEELNLQQSTLIGSSVTLSTGDLACAYDDGTMCTYSEQDGSCASGTTLCPPYVTSSTYCLPSSPWSTPYGSGSGSGSGYSYPASDYGAAAASASKGNAPAAAKGGVTDLLASDDSTSTSTSQSTRLSPALIALLALNGVLVLGLLLLGGTWLARRRSGARGAKYQSVGKDDVVDTASVPLTHGTQERYSDAPAS
ncbi:hypothetical protein B0H19DRAFT_1103959 [Mycena capillaripes]|nr:hypothetical protein B0H19DRAFT_1103959 [Mycena capillaripes]